MVDDKVRSELASVFVMVVADKGVVQAGVVVDEAVYEPTSWRTR